MQRISALAPSAGRGLLRCMVASPLVRPQLPPASPLRAARLSLDLLYCRRYSHSHTAAHYEPHSFLLLLQRRASSSSLLSLPSCCSSYTHATSTSATSTTGTTTTTAVTQRAFASRNDDGSERQHSKQDEEAFTAWLTESKPQVRSYAARVRSRAAAAWR